MIETAIANLYDKFTIKQQGKQLRQVLVLIRQTYMTRRDTIVQLIAINKQQPLQPSQNGTYNCFRKHKK